MIGVDEQRQLTIDLKEIFKRLDDLETNPFSVTGGAVPPAGTLYNHLEDDGAAWASVTNLTLPTAASIGLPGPGGRLSFNSVPAPDQIALVDADLQLSGNDFYIPDNTADAFKWLDDNGLEYLRLTTSNVQRVIDFNNAAIDTNFHVGANGVPDALQVQGSDGQITLGALATGLVKATVGVLSIAVATDLPAHNILSLQHGDTLAAAVSQGSLVYGNATPAWAELTIGAALTHLESDGTDVAWQANLTVADDAYIGLPGPGGRLAFDSTPAPDQLKVTDADLNFVTAAHGIIHVDGVAAGMVLRADGTRYVPAVAAATLPIAPLAVGDTLIATAGPVWDILTTPGAAGYARVSTATTEIWSQTPTMTGNWTWISATTNRPLLTIENTNADVQSPAFVSYKNSASPADNDELGEIRFFGNSSTAVKHRFAHITAESLDVTQNHTGSGLKFTVVMDAVERSLLELSGYNGVVNQGEVVVNQDGQDVDFRVEASGVASALQVSGFDGEITLGALGSGLVLSTVGVLSIAAAGDLPAHGGTHDVGAADPVTTTADGETTPSTILAADANGRLRLANIGVSVATNANYGILTSTAGLFVAVEARETTGVGVAGVSTDNRAGHFVSTNEDGVFVQSGGVAGKNALLANATGAARGAYGLSVSGVGVQGDSATGIAGRFNLTGAGTEILLCEDNDTDVFVVDDGGFVGVRINPPISPLHIYEDTTATGVTAGLTIEQDGTGDAVAQFLLSGGRRWVCGIDNSASDSFKFASTAGLVSNARLTLGVNGFVGIGENSNTNMVIGLTIGQAANDDEALNIRSSDVGAVRTIVETGTYLRVVKSENGSGGARLDGFKDGDDSGRGAITLVGWLAMDADVDKTTAARAIVEIQAFQTDGTDIANTVSNGNILALLTRRGGSNIAVSFWDEDGDYHYNGTLNAYDHLEDAAMARDLQRVLTGRQGVHYNEDAMIKAGILHPSEHGVMVSHKKITALQLGAHAQAYEDRRGLEARIEYLEKRLERMQ